MQPLPLSPARCRLTATWQLSVRPNVPEYWRAPPHRVAPLLGEAGVVDHQRLHSRQLRLELARQASAHLPVAPARVGHALL